MARRDYPNEEGSLVRSVRGHVAQGYSWVTTEMFDERLAKLVDELPAEQLLAIPGMYELLAEEFNNKVLESLEEGHEEAEEEDLTCSACQGTGIGAGPPDVSKCGVCKGSGERKPDGEDDFCPPDPLDYDGPPGDEGP